MIELRKGLAILRFGIDRPQVAGIVGVSDGGNPTIGRRLSWNLTEVDSCMLTKTSR